MRHFKRRCEPWCVFVRFALFIWFAVDTYVLRQNDASARGTRPATVARMSVITLPASGPYRGGGFLVADATLPPWPRISAGLWDRELPAQSNPLLGC